MATTGLEVFMYNGVPYMKVTPVKALFNSTMVHEVVNRGDIFVVNMLSGVLTVVPNITLRNRLDALMDSPIQKLDALTVRARAPKIEKVKKPKAAPAKRQKDLF
jgi:hypothetical protein